MSSALYNFRGKVLNRTTESIGFLVRLKVFGKAEVDYLDVPVNIYHYVLKLDISMDDASLVQLS